MKKKSKVLVTALCVTLIAASAMIGTMAYFTDKDSAVNTFTVGKVEITLDEADVKTDGTQDTSDRVTENEYHLIPGQSYLKDPIVHVSSESTDCYVFVTVDNQIADIEGSPTVASQMETNGWSALMNGTTPVTKTIEGKAVPVYVYTSIITQTAQDKNLEVFGTFTVDGNKTINNKEQGSQAPTGMYYIEDYQGKQIEVIAYAVQAQGFSGALEAWNTTFGA